MGPAGRVRATARRTRPPIAVGPGPSVSDALQFPGRRGDAAFII